MPGSEAEILTSRAGVLREQAQEVREEAGLLTRPVVQQRHLALAQLLEREAARLLSWVTRSPREPR